MKSYTTPRCIDCKSGGMEIDSMGILGTAMVLGVSCSECGHPAELWLSPKNGIASLTFRDLDGNVKGTLFFNLKPVAPESQEPPEDIPF